MLATLITILVVLATLTILLMNGACTQCFAGKPPQGQAAMGLVVPFFGLGGAVLVMGLAGLLACLRVSGSALGQIHSSPTVAGLIVVVVTFGAALAAGMAFMLWCEPVSVSLALRAATVPLCIALGLVGPVVLAVALLTGLWTTRDTLAANPGSAVPLRVLFWAVVALAVAGYAMGGSLLWKSLALQAANQAAALKNELERQAERLAHANKPLYPAAVPDTFIRATPSAGAIQPRLAATAAAAPALRCFPWWQWMYTGPVAIASRVARTSSSFRFSSNPLYPIGRWMYFIPSAAAFSTSGSAPSTLMIVLTPIAARVSNPASPSGTLPDTYPSWYVTAL